MNFFLSALRSNLGIALFFLPHKQRKDALLFYTFCRIIDDIADSCILSDWEKKKELITWIKLISGNTDDSDQYDPKFLKLLSDFSEMIERRKINRDQLSEIIHGVEMDLKIHRYATFKDLELYLWRVASVVGLISAQLFGAQSQAVNEYAEKLGAALQLTNILRDVAEDAAMDRIYLPLDELTRFQVSEEELLKATPSPQAIHLFNYQAERALSYFVKTERAWEKLTRHEQRLMRPARFMEAIYRELLQTIQRDRYDLFHQHYKVGIIKKMALATHLIFSC